MNVVECLLKKIYKFAYDFFHDFFHTDMGELCQSLVRSFVLVLVLACLIFEIKPSTAYVHSELEIPSDDAYPYETRLLNISGKAKELHLSTKSRSDKVLSYFCITSSKQLRIDLSGLNLNGISYQEGSYIEITPEKNKNLSIRFDGKTYDTNLIDVSFSDLKQQSFTAKKVLASFSGMTNLQIQDATVTLMDSSTGKSQLLSTETPLTLFSENLTERIQELKELKDKANTVVEENKYQSAINIGYSLVSYSVTIESIFAFDVQGANFEEISSSRLNSVKYGASGKLSIAYTPTSNEYDLQYQEVELKSPKNTLGMNYDLRTGHLLFYGYVGEATLARMSLFPDFWNWFFSNGYMAPVTLLSTVIACVPLLKMKKEDT